MGGGFDSEFSVSFGPKLQFMLWIWTWTKLNNTAAAATTEAAEIAESTAEIKNQKVKVGKMIFKCNFFLVFTGDIVNLNSSTMSCKGKGGKKTAKVSLKTAEGFSFSGVVKPPNTIVSLAGGDLF